MADILNAMTVDVEDYFHVSAFSTVVKPSDWDSYESRVVKNTDRVLAIFDAAGVSATFFVLGWVADRFPALVRRIQAAGHDLASHSYDHGLVYHKTPEAFRADLQRARDTIEQATGTSVVGYRAPSYSITRQSLWALEILEDEGYTYDSSIYPIRHDRYGIPDWERHIHRVGRRDAGLWEVPGSTIRRLAVNLPIGGGGYFRLLPYGWTRWGIRRLNLQERRPAIFYIHPWEIDPGQPHLRAGAMSRMRHYANLEHTEARLQRLLREFRFGTIVEVLAQSTAVARPAIDGHKEGQNPENS